MSRRPQLIRALESYVPTPQEVAYRDQMMALAFDHGDPFSRNHFVPGHFTASGFVLSPDGDALLLVHHRRLQRWLQPGGHIDPADAEPVAAAAREVQEETAVTIAEPLPKDLFDIDVHAIPAARGEPAHLHFDLRFLFHAESDAFVADDEVLAAAWVPITKIAAGWEDASVQRVAARLASTAGTPRYRPHRS
jgi:8-oxo-dGTP pyrophosphatase MutT (NUDIX family)